MALSLSLIFGRQDKLERDPENKRRDLKSIINTKRLKGAMLLRAGKILCPSFPISTGRFGEQIFLCACHACRHRFTWVQFDVSG